MTAALPPEEPEIERVLDTLDLYANGADAYCMVSAGAARLIRALRADFTEYAQHMLPSPRHKLGCLTREMHPPSQTFNFKCDCGLDAARERWGCK